jgi:hypothetical protein
MPKIHKAESSSSPKLSLIHKLGKKRHYSQVQQLPHKVPQNLILLPVLPNLWVLPPSPIQFAATIRCHVLTRGVWRLQHMRENHQWGAIGGSCWKYLPHLSSQTAGFPRFGDGSGICWAQSKAPIV